MVISSQKTILVLEDDLVLYRVIQRKISGAGFLVLQASNAREAYKILTEKSVDVIWLDHYLLGAEDGLAFAEKIRSLDRFSTIPIFVISNSASQDKILSYRKFGIKKYYTKSNSSLEEIVRDIAQFLGTV